MHGLGRGRVWSRRELSREVTRLTGPVLELRAAARMFGAVAALRPVSLTLDPGTITVIGGANGSGKSTLLRVAAGLLAPTSGSRACRGRALYLAPDGGGRAVERVHQSLRFAAQVTGADGQSALRAALEAMERLGLSGLEDRRVGELSSGQRARLSVAQMLVVNPALACLDEPTAHLDDAGVGAVSSAVRKAAGATTAVLIATHDTSRFRSIADSYLRLTTGSVAAVDSVGCKDDAALARRLS